MTKPFFIKLDRAAGVYRPAEPEYADCCYTSATDGPRDGIKETQFGIINDQFPGVFHRDESNDDYRREVFDTIEANTKALIAAGFDFQGLRFANNVDARGQYTALYVLRDDPLFEWPIEFATLDDMDTIELADPGTARLFCLTSAAHFIAIKKTGTDIKKQVCDMPAEDLGSFADPRMVAP